MLTLENNLDELKNYHRASDMIDFLYFFPEASKLERLALCLDKEDYLNNKEYLDTFDSYRIDSPKEYSIIEGIEGNGMVPNILDLFDKVKSKNKHGVILFFDLVGKSQKRYKYDAGISVNINLYEDVCIEAVGKGFDGREISKGVCVHERYLIPWFEVRSLNVDNFKKYQIYQIDQNKYYETRQKRIDYLLSLGEKTSNFTSYIPPIYKPISNEIWKDLITTILVNLNKKEEILEKSNFKHFAIGGNVYNNECYIWQMYNKDRFN